MAVPLDERGHHEPPSGVDAPGARPDESPDLRVGPYCDDPVAADGDGLRAGMRGIDSNDSSVQDDEVSALLPAHGGSNDEENDDEQGNDAK